MPTGINFYSMETKQFVYFFKSIGQEIYAFFLFLFIIELKFAKVQSVLFYLSHKINVKT